MRRTLTITLTALALVLPSVDALAAAAAQKAPLKKIIVAKKSFTGSLGQADQWGNVQVTIVVKKTTTLAGTKKTVKRHIESIARLESEDEAVVGHCVRVARLLGERLGYGERGYRVSCNTGPEGGQVVYHLHLHFTAGRRG